jgi:hypothetical protein
MHKPALDNAAEAFVTWVDRMIARPAGAENPAWKPGRLEYRFACSAPVEGGEPGYLADEYHTGTLDWDSVDVELRAVVDRAGVEALVSVPRRPRPVARRARGPRSRRRGGPRPARA